MSTDAIQVWLVFIGALFFTLYCFSDQPHQFVISQINIVGSLVIAALKNKHP
jgi:hypothetical protein